MGYEVKIDISIEYPLFIEIVGRLHAAKWKTLFDGREKCQVRCPRCNKHKAVMDYVKSKDSFVLVCPVDGCDLKGVILYDLIKRYGGEEMFDRWRQARWTPTY